MQPVMVFIQRQVELYLKHLLWVVYTSTCRRRCAACCQGMFIE
jgi:hypothetical protein